ncbi:hypothetical protein THAOC_01691 [Thalassiosira oceanica]|uniref:Thioredoxin domain-containing protein n=1 Tax=Thalassiosira oceanica TaxID=159749 RepID=K0THQ5_THAOC|nr:hypothetical protein THAOC_01691 [Thalassiosira oceanica]|eukprot:EJK76544.1 hypothetical protein THAOC_01691 [Thalassiosira oceanica]
MFCSSSLQYLPSDPFPSLSPIVRAALPSPPPWPLTDSHHAHANDDRRPRCHCRGSSCQFVSSYGFRPGISELFEPSTFSSLLRATNTGIVSVTDENIDDILCGPRPVLVDAFAPWWWVLNDATLVVARSNFLSPPTHLVPPNSGPCKLLIKVLRKLQPSYDGRVDFVRWNVDDKSNTRLKQLFVDSGYTLTKLPSLVVFRDGKPIAARDGFANEYQIDSFLERSLPDYLPRTFDDDGVKISAPVVEEISPALDEMAGALRTIIEVQEKKPGYQLDTVAVAMSTRTRSMRAERILWQNRTVLP